MGIVDSAFTILFNIVLPLAITCLFVWAFIDAAARPARQFAVASQSKNFWLVILGVGALAEVATRFQYLLHLYVPFSGFIRLAFLIALVYYLGPERSKMGRRPGSGRGTQRGTW
ncbi:MULTISPECIES: DUF2516 family protein [Trueperella]|uniref:DUF2516 family protein n=1 Tax=Trueperella abortisuis TaxID=445930 RepID=A0ABT9PMR0_9ACTO|nr:MULTISPECIES: DUF2516 family protein [Trueperella]MCI7304752.1 DUF2516 family protein [Trueperella sp.]MDP9833240.1 hypothetical protein [Trueperella abortisuis]MDY5403436.1 DUF2516 family protein [Trueperella sp.]